MKPNIFICGPSGTGKSSSLRNLNPETTCVLNTEQKALPFKGAGKFKMNVPIADYKKASAKVDFDRAFNKAITSDDIETIVVESFTSLTEMIFRECDLLFSGFEVWGEYNKRIDKVLHASKSTSKNVIFLGIDEFVENDGGVDERFVKVQGKAWKKSVEKEFVMVLYTDVNIDEKGLPNYRFITNKCEGHTQISAKSPMEMLPTYMENDLEEVIKLATEYYN
jgi:hypothetical protein